MDATSRGTGARTCHSLFAGYLMQDRELQGWRNIFLSPFHREMKMSPQEREEFARYSALNMPMKIEDVPAGPAVLIEAQPSLRLP